MCTQPSAYDGPFRFQRGTADVDPEWIDIDTIKTWLWTCDVEHNPRCFETSLFESGGPRWLIDVVKGCLVPAEAHDQYAALSYVWGQTETIKTAKDNLAYLLEEGSIFAHESLLPRTIRDTIRLLELLDIKYLWVDCLCIVQDDAEVKHAQIQEMGSVYARAYVTIIAANGWDANHGLRGIRNVTEPRHLSRYVEDNFYESLQPYSSIWYSRGWTFQEMVFARRKIMFHYQVAVWECQCATWHEATKTNKVPSITNATGSVFQMNRWGWRNTFSLWPDVRQYIEYNNRQLTFPADGLQAIAGLMAVWNRSFHGGFICGLPQMFFDDALLWQPCNLINRRVSKESGSNQMVLPSWSWAGWEGEIESSKWASEWDYLSLGLHKGAVKWKLTSTVEWTYGVSREIQQSIDVSSYHYRRCHFDESVPLPPGWSRKPAAAGIIPYKGNDAQIANNNLTKHTHFVHTRFPGINFSYPVPLPKKDHQNRSQTLPQFLFGRTRRGYFKESTRDFGVRVYDNGGPVLASEILIFLQDNHGKWAGMLQLHDRALVSSHRYTLLDRSNDLELVSISAGTFSSVHDARCFNVLRKLGIIDCWRTDIFEFYNVLWIEWKDGVAYRKGLGRVRKEAWESQATEWIDLTLGEVRVHYWMGRRESLFCFFRISVICWWDVSLKDTRLKVY